MNLLKLGAFLFYLPILGIRALVRGKEAKQ